jgi:UDP-glucose 4-epimerase
MSAASPSGRKLLLLGAAGFLGRAVVREFQARGWEIFGADAAPGQNAPAGIAYEQISLPSPGLAELIRRVQPDACVHAAGRASVALSMQDPAADFRDGVVVTFELFDALRQHAPGCRTVLLSSAAVYGNPVALPIREDHAPAPLSPYGFHKWQIELLAEEFAKIFALPVASARIFSAYGAGLRRQVVWDICEKALRGGGLKLRGTGKESRDFIHARDVASALAVLVERAPMRGERYNLASGEETTIAELAAALLPMLELGATAEFGAEENAGDPKNWRADISRLQALGYRPRVSLTEGLRGVAAFARAELGI